LGKKPPFIGQKTVRYRVFGALWSGARSSSRLYSGQSIASLLSPEQSPEQLWISLRICKIAKTLIRKTQHLLHQNSIFRKLGLFKKLKKITTTLCRETPRIVKSKIPNMDRCETFQSEEPVKPLNSKTQ
jgi:hypothetical protein